jgi:hypothetical protein
MIEPDDTSSIPDIRFNKVLFPLPEGPVRATVVPVSMLRFRLLRTLI